MSRQAVVVITGASKGIGLAVTSILLREFDAVVVALSRSRSPELLGLKQAHTHALTLIDCDVTNEQRLCEAISHAQQTYGGIDALILNAATLDPLGRISDPEIGTNEWRAHFDVNFFSHVTALKATIPALRVSDLGGRVVFVSSGAAVKGMAGWGPYSAGKAATNSLCRTLAREEPSITAVALRPGVVDTFMQEKLRAAGAPHMTANDHQAFLQQHAQGKLVKPEDPGRVIAALAIKAPKSLSGQFVSWDSEECREFRK